MAVDEVSWWIGTRHEVLLAPLNLAAHRVLIISILVSSPLLKYPISWKRIYMFPIINHNNPWKLIFPFSSLSSWFSHAIFSFFLFVYTSVFPILDASSHSDKRVCPFVSLSLCPSVCLLAIHENGNSSLENLCAFYWFILDVTSVLASRQEGLTVRPYVCL